MKSSDQLPNVQEGDSKTIRAATEILSGGSKKSWFARLMPFLGPAFIASVAYMDPGNFATNIQAGAKFGYMLLWVILGSNLMAMLIQSLLGAGRAGRLASQQTCLFRLTGQADIPQPSGFSISTSGPASMACAVRFVLRGCQLSACVVGVTNHGAGGACV